MGVQMREGMKTFLNVSIFCVHANNAYIRARIYTLTLSTPRAELNILGRRWMRARAAHITSMQISLCRVKQRASQVWETRGNVREIWIARVGRNLNIRRASARTPFLPRNECARDFIWSNPRLILDSLECARQPNNNTFSLEWEESEAKKRLCARRQYQYNNDKDFF